MSEATQLATAFETARLYNPVIHDVTDCLAFSNHEVWSDKPNYHWEEALTSRIGDLISLPIGWDGYNGKPVSWQCAQFAMEILQRLYRENVPPPSIVPGSDGSLQMEWHRNGYDVELDILSVNNVVATLICHDNESEDQELEIGNDFSPIVAWIELIADRETQIADRNT